MDEIPIAPPRVRRLALRCARLTEAAGPLPVGAMRETLVECTRRPGRMPCPGFLRVTKLGDDRLYAWCPLCRGDQIYISEWQDSLFADGPMAPVNEDASRSPGAHDE
jgi:hypothetical protein